jgi:hypothetical protein
MSKRESRSASDDITGRVKHQGCFRSQVGTLGNIYTWFLYHYTIELYNNTQQSDSLRFYLNWSFKTLCGVETLRNFSRQKFHEVQQMHLLPTPINPDHKTGYFGLGRGHGCYIPMNATRTTQKVQCGHPVGGVSSIPPSQRRPSFIMGRG